MDRLFGGVAPGFLNDKAASFDLIHIHEVWHYPGYVAFRAASKHKLPCVLTIHGELSEWGLRQKALKKQIYRLILLDRMLRNVSALHAVTHSEKEQVVKLGYENPGSRSSKRDLKPAQFDALPDPVGFYTAFFPALKGKRVILFLGRLHPKKGLDILAQSFLDYSPAFLRMPYCWSWDLISLVPGKKMESILGFRRSAGQDGVYWVAYRRGQTGSDELR